MGVAVWLAAALCCALSAPASAHGFGQRYDLPLPLSLYLFATAAAVVLSFVVVALTARHPPRGYPRLHIPFRLTWLPVGLKLLAVLLFALVVAAGLVGNQDPYRNIAPTLVWIIFWVGLAIVSAFIGDLWALLNPWRNLFDWAELLCRRPLSLRLRYPERLGAWLAVTLLFAVAWTELVYPSPAVPATIALLLLAYSLLTWVGMALFGPAEWTRRGEIFSVYFGLFARFAPTEASGGGLALRPYAAGLVDEAPASPSMVAFVLLVLASVLYDGLLTTPEWEAAETWLGPPLFTRTIGLLLFWGVFLVAFLAICAAMSRAAGQRSPGDIAQRFALTLVPIAIAYHLAHYLTYLLTQGQYAIPLLSDPFGFGWNLLGTAGYRADIAVAGARFAWYAAVTSIVTGHIVAVYLADVRARQVFAERGAGLRAQVPLTALMVIYTFVSLSILAEPIVERRAPGQPVSASADIPADALLPEAGTGRLVPLGPGRTARVKLGYRVLGSAFHDGTAMTAADLLYAYSFAYRWAPSDPAVAAATAPLRERLRAVRITGVDTASKSFRIADVEFTRQLFLVDVYLDVPSIDPEQDAVFAPPWTTVPWHLLALIEEAAARGWATFAQLDLVRSEALKARLAPLVDEFAQTGFRPPALAALVGEGEAKRRWSALAAFARERGHFLVANGPYRLKSWSEQSATLEVFRDLSYPLGVGSYDNYAVPRRGYVNKVERTAVGLRLLADIEIVEKFMRDYDIVRRPLAALDVPVRQRAQPECRYVVIAADGAVALTGNVPPEPDQSFLIALDTRLPPGQYTVMAEILVNGNAMNAAIEKIPVTIPGAR